MNPLPPPASNDPLIGVVLQDRYRVVRKLGEGGMGAVYEAEHILIKKRVAVKCLHAQFAQKPDIVVRFQREAVASTSIGNEHIIEVNDLGTLPDGSIFMALEFLEGHDLNQEIKVNGPFTLGRSVHILSQMCEALTAAHSKGIVHRDLKPANVFLIRRNGDPDFVKVLDFGISKFLDAVDGEATNTGVALGTPQYMAPEQALGRKDIDHRADIFALGVILYRMLTRRLPFTADSLPLITIKICSEPAPPVRDFRPDLPEQLEWILARMMAKNPAERFPDCASVRDALAPFANVFNPPAMQGRASGGADSASGSPSHPSGNPLTPSPFQSRTPAPASGSFPGAPPGFSAGSFPSGAIAPGMSPPTGTLPAVSLAAPVAPVRSSAPMVIGALVVALGGIGAALAASGVFSHKPDSHAAIAPPAHSPVAESARTTEHVAAEPPPSPPPSPPASNAQAPAMVAIRITTEPEDAQLFLDDHRVPNPFDGQLPQSTQPRKLEARAPGHTSEVQELVLEFPQTVRIRLHRGGGTVDHRANHASVPVPTTAPVVERPANPPPEHHDTVVVPPSPNTAHHRNF